MALRSGHGNGRGTPRVEVLPVDELPAGRPGQARPEAVRDDAGRFVKGTGTAELARAGGKAAHEAKQLARLLGLWQPEEGHPYLPYYRLACDWRDAHMAQVAATVGGGEVGPGPASVISTAAIQLGASRYLSDLGARSGDAKLLLDASRLADASRQNLLAAHELAAKEAQARPKTPAQVPWEIPDPPAPSRALPKTPSRSSENNPTSERHPGAAIDKVEGPDPTEEY